MIRVKGSYDFWLEYVAGEYVGINDQIIADMAGYGIND
jgi:hypothetical protein